LEDGEYFRDIYDLEQWESLKLSVIQICKELRPNAIALSDLVQLPNIMGVTLGNEDLDIYNRFINAVKTGKGNSERAPWWKELYH